MLQVCLNVDDHGPRFYSASPASRAKVFCLGQLNNFFLARKWKATGKEAGLLGVIRACPYPIHYKSTHKGTLRVIRVWWVVFGLDVRIKYCFFLQVLRPEQKSFVSRTVEQFFSRTQVESKWKGGGHARCNLRVSVSNLVQKY